YLPDRPLDLVFADRPRVALRSDVTIGRGPGNTVRLTDPSVSRHHARIWRRDGQLVIADLGSSHGTWVDGVRISGPTALGDSSKIRLGDQQLAIDRPRESNESSATIVVPARLVTRGLTGGHPRLRSGYAMKPLAASEGARRYVLADVRSGGFVRLTGNDHRVLGLLDGSRSPVELLADARRQLGPGGDVQMARLLADLADHGRLEGVDGRPPAPGPRGILRPREWVWDGAGRAFQRLYRL